LIPVNASAQSGAGAGPRLRQLAKLAALGSTGNRGVGAGGVSTRVDGDAIGNGPAIRAALAFLIKRTILN
jgi:hypothetical protein